MGIKFLWKFAKHKDCCIVLLINNLQQGSRRGTGGCLYTLKETERLFRIIGRILIDRKAPRSIFPAPEVILWALIGKKTNPPIP